jgi:uncharacterized membrane protein YgaE (UPF0421/DUF939 family)
MNKILAKIAFKLFSIGIITGILIFYTFGLQPALIAGVGGILINFVNMKGFYPKRRLIRTFFIILAINIGVLLIKFNNYGILFTLIITFIFVFIITFSSLEEEIGGVMIHLPILIVFFMTMSATNNGSINFLSEIVGLSIGIFITQILGIIFLKDNLDLSMKTKIKNYLNKCLIEIKAMEEEKDTELLILHTREAYKDFLKEFYKISNSNGVKNSLGERLFNFFLFFHSFMEDLRSKELTAEEKNTKKFSKIIENILEFDNTQNFDFKKIPKYKEIEKIILERHKENKKKSGITYTLNNQYRENFSNKLSLNSIAFRYSLKMAFLLSLGVYISYLIHSKQAFWLPIAMMLVIMPYGGQSKQKIIDRILGTLAGIGAAAVLIPIIQNPLYILIIIFISILIGLYFIMDDIVFGILFFTLSVLMANVLIYPPTELYFKRGFYVILGTLIVFIFELIVVDRKNKIIDKEIHKLIESDLQILTGVKKVYLGEKIDMNELFRSSYISRDLLENKLKYYENNEEYQKILHFSFVFLEKIITIYTLIKEEKLQDNLVEEFEIMEMTFKKYLTGLSEEEETYFSEKLELLRNSMPKDNKLHQLLIELNDYFEY